MKRNSKNQTQYETEYDYEFESAAKSGWWKRLLLILFIIIATILFFTRAAHGQVFIGLAAGYSSAKAPVVNLNAGYRAKRLYAEYDQKAHADRHNPLYFGLRAGYVVYAAESDIVPMAGLYYRLVSTDRPWLNGWNAGAGIRWYRGHIYVEAAYVNKTALFTIGTCGFIN